MYRFTNKYSNGCYTHYEQKPNEDYDYLVEKLGKLEDIEEELGIDLYTLFKALEEGIYDKYIHYDNVCLLRDKIYACPVDIFDTSFYLKDYGKTWSLDKSDLVNDIVEVENEYY